MKINKLYNEYPNTPWKCKRYFKRWGENTYAYRYLYKLLIDQFIVLPLKHFYYEKNNTKSS